MTPRATHLPRLFAPACVDLFAGGGGWSIGAERAFLAGGHTDRRMDLAINHWHSAIACHEANHPLTEHAHASVWDVDPSRVLPGRRIAYLHASPDCTHFSRARGSS